MVVSIREKSQITIPKFAISELNIQPGDKFEVEVKDGAITLVPVAVYPKKYIEKLRKEVNEAKVKKNSTFSSVEEMFNALENK